MTGLARITATRSSVRLMATVSQPSYPLNSENASPPGTCRVYLSCAEMTLAPKTASTTVAVPMVHMLLQFIAARPFISQQPYYDVAQGPRGSSRVQNNSSANRNTAASDVVTVRYHTELPRLVDHHPKIRRRRLHSIVKGGVVHANRKKPPW